MVRLSAFSLSIFVLLLSATVHASVVLPGTHKSLPAVTAHPPSGGSDACTEAQKGCLAAAKKNAKDSEAGKMISECKKLRLCKQVCRMVKQEAVMVCKSEKDLCKDECKAKYGMFNLKAWKCKRGCRSDKRVCKKEARADKRECKSECRDTWLTPACKAARQKVMTSILKTVGSCAAMTSCINASK